MKRKMLIGIVLIVFILSTYSIGKSYSSNNTLYYDGSKKEFTYYNLDKEDLFDEFKDLMPGDTRYSVVNIKGMNITKKTNLYLRLDTNVDDDILQYIEIMVYKDNQLLENYDDLIKITNLNDDDQIELKLQIHVPTSVDNIISEKERYLRWSFLIEEEGELVEVPKTYDNSHIIFYTALLIISIIGLIIVISSNKGNIIKKDLKS